MNKIEEIMALDRRKLFEHIWTKYHFKKYEELVRSKIEFGSVAPGKGWKVDAELIVGSA